MNDLLKMEPISVPNLIGNVAPSFCEDDCIATYAGYVGATYEYRYFDALNFRFDMDQYTRNGIGRSIILETKFKENDKRYVGVDRDFLQVDKNEAIGIIRRELANGRPVMIALKGFWCPWDWRYQAIEIGGHSTLVVAYDKNSEKFQCTDPYYMKKHVFLTKDEFQNGYIGIATIKWNEAEINNPLDVLEKNVSNLIKSGSINEIRNMAIKVKENFDFEKEISNYNPSEFWSLDSIQDRVYLNLVIKDITHNKIRFALLLNRLACNYLDKEEAFTKMAKEIILLGEKWETARMMLLKKIFVKNKKNITEYLSNKILSIADDEEHYIKALLEILCQDNTYSNEVAIEEEHPEIYHYMQVDIEQFFNNCGFGRYGSTIADFNGNGEYMIDDPNCCDIRVKHHQVDLKIRKTDGKFDNIACTSENITVDERCYYKILLIGCSEWGDFKDDMQLIYSDGTRERKTFELQDWLPAIQKGRTEQSSVKLEKSIVLNGTQLVGVEDCFLYAVEIGCNNKKPLKKIILPECANMHLFALFLGR